MCYPFNSAIQTLRNNVILIHYKVNISSIRLDHHIIGFYHLSNFGKEFLVFFAPIDNIIKAPKRSTQ